MQFRTDRKVNDRPLERRGVLLSIVVHATLLGILFVVAPQGEVPEATATAPVEVFFFPNPTLPEVAPPAVQEVIQTVESRSDHPAPPAPRTVADPPDLQPPLSHPVDKIRTIPFVDKAFKASPPPSTQAPFPQERSVNTEVFGDSPPNPKQPDRAPATTGTFDRPVNQRQQPATAQAVHRSPGPAGFEGDSGIRRLHPTERSGVSPITVQATSFDSGPPSQGGSDRLDGRPTSRSGISTTPITISSFDRSTAHDRTAPRTRRTVRSGSFRGTQPGPGSRPAKKLPVPDPDEPVEIVSKPKPVYTEEARRLRVEGVVLLEVLFEASGRLRVLRVLEGLGHGLDEAAVEATRKIKYKSARLQGRAVDHTATLRVVFRLA